MPILHKSRVKEIASNKPNAATAFNLPESAATGFRSFDAAFATADLLPYRADNGTDWEEGIGTFTAGTPDTLARTTILQSSNADAAVDFSAGGDVTVTCAWPATIGEQAHQIVVEADAGAHLISSAASVTTANVTGVIGTMHVLTIAGLTADRDFVLPAVCAVGDRVGVITPDGDATYALVLKGATGDTITGAGSTSAAGAEWSRLFIAGECVIFRCITADSAWVVECDGRIPCTAAIALSTDGDGEAAATRVLPTTVGGAWATLSNTGTTIDLSTGKITVRRSGVCNVFAAGRSKDGIADQKYYNIGINKNAVGLDDTTVNCSTATTQVVRATSAAPSASVITGDYFQLTYMSQDGGVGIRGISSYLSSLAITEVL